jgi:hypothetical protein
MEISPQPSLLKGSCSARLIKLARFWTSFLSCSLCHCVPRISMIHGKAEQYLDSYEHYQVHWHEPAWETWKTPSIRATLDKGPGTKSPGTNLKQIEPWIGPFLILKKTLFPNVQWVCLKAWGPIWGSNIKMCDWLYERIRSTLDFFCFFSLLFCIFGKLKLHFSF